MSCSRPRGQFLRGRGQMPWGQDRGQILRGRGQMPWGQDRGQILRGRGRIIWPRGHIGLNIPALQFAIWHLWDYPTLLCCGGDDWCRHCGGGAQPSQIFDCWSNRLFCQCLRVFIDANNVGKTPKFLSRNTPTLFYQHPFIFSGITVRKSN